MEVSLLFTKCLPKHYFRLINRRILRKYCISNQLDVDDQKEWKKEEKKTKLFLSGRQAMSFCALVSPQLDYEFLINNAVKVSENCASRRINKIDVKLLVEKLITLTKLKVQLEEIKSMKELKLKELNDSSDLTETLQNQHNELKRKALALSELVWDNEEAIFSDLSRLPNQIHPDTQLQDVFEYGHRPEFSFPIKSHIELGEINHCVKFSPISPTMYYLESKAASLEMALSDYFYNIMAMQQFVHVIGPDFSKSVILEGCGKTFEDINSTVTIDEQENEHLMHLTGNASLEAFVAPLTRTLVDMSSLPLLYFAIGRHYEQTQDLIKNDLFSVVQDVVVKSFIATVPEESIKEFYRLRKLIEQHYKDMNLPFRVVQVAAHRLTPAESLKVEFDLWSPHKNQFVNVGHISLCTDYISRRLMMTYGVGKKSEGHLHIIEATVASISVIIGCIMENLQNNDGTFDVPNVIIPYLNKLR